MTRTWQLKNGFPLPLGATITADGVNFAVFSEHASQLYLCLFNEQGDEIAHLPFSHKTRGIWHMEVLELQVGQHYGLRADGPFAPEDMHFFNPHKLLIDPYAKALSTRFSFAPEQVCITTDEQMDQRDSAAVVPKSVVHDMPKADQSLKPNIDRHTRCLYEMHIKGFSQHLDIDPSLKGTYLGACSEPAITHLKKLGITTLQVMPCFAFADEIHLQEKGLSNYWGYNPINFFTPDDRYACEDANSECQTMIETFHKAGFEVILDVVYNHTAESEQHHGTSCYRGLDNAIYYRHQQGHYLNFTGCGNCVNTYHPAVVRLICDSMRYWVDTMGVDGFRFDLGVDLGREQHDFSPTAPLLQAILQDPTLSQTTLVMEPWDIGPNGYQLGQFPRSFIECNDKYRDTVRRFWRGDEHVVPEFATRLMGSRDVFHKGHKCALHSVNYITYHDGYTLNDLVSYHRRHNLGNLENNRDGHTENISQNFGIEGPTDDSHIQARRLNQQKCFLATLFFSQGTPHLLGGDELCHTQNGNNNAYCQDNETTWLPWHNLSDDASTLTETIAQLLELRQHHPVLAEIKLPDDPLYQHQDSGSVDWFNEQGAPMSADDWANPEQDFISLTLRDHDDSKILWVLFYREDMSITIYPPNQSNIDKVLFSTGSYDLNVNDLSIKTRSVILIELKS